MVLPTLIYRRVRSKVATLTSTESLLNELMSLQTKEVVIDDSLSQPTQTLLEQLKVLMSDQPEVMPSAEVSYVSQDLQQTLEKQTVKQLLAYLTTTQKRSLAHLQKAVHYEPSHYLKLDHNAQRNLELLKNLRTHKKSGDLALAVRRD